VKKPVLIGVLLFAALVAFMIYRTMSMSGFRVEACMQFNGRTSCRTAAGSTREFAQRTAISNACAEIASGVTDSIACEHSDPVKLTWK
jgi:hypothetical protein